MYLGGLGASGGDGGLSSTSEFEDIYFFIISQLYFSSNP